MKNKAFTLVELIVVITILAILGTISFISFTGYTSEARDSSRLADMSTIKKAIEIFEINNNKLPDISNPSPIYYNWEVIFKQWTFWSQTISSLKWQIGNFPVDPMSWKYYSYSLSNTKREYEIGSFFENADYISFVDKANAAQKTKALLKWNYNSRALSLRSWNNIQIIASPSITVNDLSSDDFEQIINQNNFVYNKYYNLPANFWETGYDLYWSSQDVFVNQSNIELYNWSFDDLKLNSQKLQLLHNMQQAYSWTNIDSSIVISWLLSNDISWSSDESLDYITRFLTTNISNKLN